MNRESASYSKNDNSNNSISKSDFSIDAAEFVPANVTNRGTSSNSTNIDADPNIYNNNNATDESQKASCGVGPGLRPNGKPRKTKEQRGPRRRRHKGGVDTNDDDSVHGGGTVTDHGGLKLEQALRNGRGRDEDSDPLRHNMTLSAMSLSESAHSVDTTSLSSEKIQSSNPTHANRAQRNGNRFTHQKPVQLHSFALEAPLSMTSYRTNGLSNTVGTVDPTGYKPNGKLSGKGNSWDCLYQYQYPSQVPQTNDPQSPAGPRHFNRTPKHSRRNTATSPLSYGNKNYRLSDDALDGLELFTGSGTLTGYPLFGPGHGWMAFDPDGRLSLTSAPSYDSLPHPYDDLATGGAGARTGGGTAAIDVDGVSGPWWQSALPHLLNDMRLSESSASAGSEWVSLQQEWAASKHRGVEEADIAAEEAERRKWGAWAVHAAEAERERRMQILREIELENDQERSNRRRWAAEMIERERSERISAQFLVSLSSTRWFTDMISAYHEDYELVCPYYRQGCRANVTRGTINGHLLVCLFASERPHPMPVSAAVDDYEVVCPNAVLGCAHIGSRSSLQRHLQSECMCRGQSETAQQQERASILRSVIAQSEEERSRRMQLLQSQQQSRLQPSQSSTLTVSSATREQDEVLLTAEGAMSDLQQLQQQNRYESSTASATSGSETGTGRAAVHGLLQMQMKSVLGELHDEVASVWARHVERTPLRVARDRAIQALLADLRICVAQLWPFARVEPFGSYATGLQELCSGSNDGAQIGAGNGVSTSSGDLDLVVCFSDDHQELLSVRGTLPLLHALADHLERRSPHTGLILTNVLLHARIPVIKARATLTVRLDADTDDPSRKGGSQDESPGTAAVETLTLSVDISLDGPTHSGLATTELVRTMLTSLPPLGPVFLVLKAYLRRQQLCDAYTGGLPSYGLLLLLLLPLLRRACIEERISREKLGLSDSRRGSLLTTQVPSAQGQDSILPPPPRVHTLNETSHQEPECSHSPRDTIKPTYPSSTTDIISWSGHSIEISHQLGSNPLSTSPSVTPYATSSHLLPVCRSPLPPRPARPLSMSIVPPTHTGHWMHPSSTTPTTSSVGSGSPSTASTTGRTGSLDVDERCRYSRHRSFAAPWPGHTHSHKQIMMMSPAPAGAGTLDNAAPMPLPTFNRRYASQSVDGGAHSLVHPLGGYGYFRQPHDGYTFSTVTLQREFGRKVALKLLGQDKDSIATASSGEGGYISNTSSVILNAAVPPTAESLCANRESNSTDLLLMSPLPEHDQPQLTMTQNDTLHFMAPPVPTNSSPTISTVGVASSSSPSHPPLLRTASEDMRLNSPLSQPLVPLLSSDRPVYGLIIDEFLRSHGLDMHCGRHGYSARDGGFRFDVHGSRVQDPLHPAGMPLRPAHPQATDPLLIEDPVDVFNNVARNCFRAATLQKVLLEAHERLTAAAVRHQLVRGHAPSSVASSSTHESSKRLVTGATTPTPTVRAVSAPPVAVTAGLRTLSPLTRTMNNSSSQSSRVTTPTSSSTALNKLETAESDCENNRNTSTEHMAEVSLRASKSPASASAEQGIPFTSAHRAQDRQIEDSDTPVSTDLITTSVDSLDFPPVSHTSTINIPRDDLTSPPPVVTPPQSQSPEVATPPPTFSINRIAIMRARFEKPTCNSNGATSSPFSSQFASVALAHPKQTSSPEMISRGPTDGHAQSQTLSLLSAETRVRISQARSRFSSACSTPVKGLGSDQQSLSSSSKSLFSPINQINSQRVARTPSPRAQSQGSARIPLSPLTTSRDKDSGRDWNRDSKSPQPFRLSIGLARPNTPVQPVSLLMEIFGLQYPPPHCDASSR